MNACDRCNRHFETVESLNQHKNSVHGIVNIAVKRRELAKGRIIGVVSVIMLVLVVGYFSITSFTGRAVEHGLYDEFAQCLTDQGAVFYGAYWCPHCKEQKGIFGPSIEFVDYVECDDRGKDAQPTLCIEKGIRGYPTWVIDGKKYEGVQTLGRLSQLTNCPL